MQVGLGSLLEVVKIKVKNISTSNRTTIGKEIDRNEVNYCSVSTKLSTFAIRAATI